MDRIIKMCLLLIVVFTFSCNKSTNNEFSEIDTWYLGWRMIENTWNGKMKTAEIQFDSLLNFNESIDIEFLKIGLVVKHLEKRYLEVNEILKNQDEKMLDQICADEYLKAQDFCSGVDFKIENEELQLEIIKMFINDQYIRSNLREDLLEKYKLVKSEVILDSFGINTEERNTRRIKEIILEHGFPTKRLVGLDAMDGVFYLIQHSDMDNEWQKSQLENMKRAVAKGDLDGPSYAYLYDRVQTNQGKEQMYGTQISKLDAKNGIAELAPTSELEKLNERRREVGMMPIEMYKRKMLKPIKK